MGGGARNHGGTRGHGCLPVPGEKANYNLHTLSDRKLSKIINISEKVKEKQPANQKLMLVKVLPQIKYRVTLDQEVVEDQTHNTKHKYKKKSSAKVLNDQRSQHNKISNVDKIKTVLSAVSGGGSAETINDATSAPADPVKKLKIKKAMQSRLDGAVEKLPRVAPAPADVVTAPYGGSVKAVNASTGAKGDLLKKLDSVKAAQPEMDDAVKSLPSQKSEYKSVRGSDWKPGGLPAPAADEHDHAKDSDESIHCNDSAQKDLGGMLESNKAGKPDSDESVKKYKALPRSDCKPGVSGGGSAETINDATAAPADPVKKLKVEKAMQSGLDGAVEKLHRVAPVPAAVVPVPYGGSVEAVNASTEAQGDLLKRVASVKTAKHELDDAVQNLPSQKSEYESVRGSDWKPGDLPVPAADENDHDEDLSKSTHGNDSAQEDLGGMLESDKAGRPESNESVKKYKAVPGSDCKPGVVPVPADVEPVYAKDSTETINDGNIVQGEVQKLVQEKTEATSTKSISIEDSAWKSGEALTPAAVEALPSRAINVVRSAQSVLVTKQKFEKAQSEVDEAVTKLMTEKAGCKTTTGLDMKPEKVPSSENIKPKPARRSSETINPATADQGFKGMKLMCEQAAQPDVDDYVKNLPNLEVECKATAGSKWKTEVAHESTTESVPHVGSAEAISAANTNQGNLMKKLGSGMSDLHDCSYFNYLGNLPDRHLPQQMFANQIPAPEGNMQQFFSYQESASSFQHPVYWILPHPCYGYSFPLVFMDNTLIFMEDQVSMHQPSEAFKIDGHLQD